MSGTLATSTAAEGPNLPWSELTAPSPNWDERLRSSSFTTALMPPAVGRR